MQYQEGETYKTHLPCPYDACGSSDAVSIYKKYDKHDKEYLDGFCFSCQKKVSSKTVETFYGENFEGISEGEDDWEVDEEVIEKLEDVKKLECGRGFKERKLKIPVNEMYEVRTEFDERNRPVTRYYPVRDQASDICGYKIKRPQIPKKEKNHFGAMGVVKNKCQLFGQHLYPKGGKFLIIVGGEEDTLAMKQTMMKFNPKYDTPVVSPITGEPSLDKQIKENYDWVTSFEKVIIILDNDETGKQSAEKAAKLLKPGQAHIAQLRLNDPCDYVKKGLDKELFEAFWNAVNHGKYTPAGVVGSSQTFDALMERANWVKLELPPFAKRLQAMMNGGFAFGEIINIVAASSVGKTTVVNEFLYHFVFNSTHKIGVIPLESDMGELIENLVSVHLGVKLANMDDEEKRELYKTDKFKKAYKELTTLPNGEDRFIILDHQGDVCDDDLKNKIEYMVKGCDCRGIILDPLTLALSGKQNEGMDEFMSWLLRFVKREKIVHINVAHVRKSGSGAKANSTGADIHEEDIKGCLDADSEVLTPNGWVRISDYQSGDLIYQWDGGEVTAVEPLEYHVLECKQGFNHFYNKGSVDMMLSDEHRMLLQKPSGEFYEQKAEDYVKEGVRSYLPVHYNNSEGLGLEEAEIKLLVAIAADGHYHGKGRCKLEVKKERKKTRIEQLLDLNGVAYTYSDTNKGSRVYRFDAIRDKKELNLCQNWYRASSKELMVLLEECIFWDGTDGGGSGRYFYTSKYKEADVVQHAAHANGFTSKIGKHSGKYYYVSVSREGSSKCNTMLRKDNLSIKKVPSEDGYKYCFSVPSGFFIARRNGRVFVTGNSGSIFQVGMINILLMRDKENENPIVRNTTKVVVSKARRTGNTGPAGFWFYNNETARLEEGFDPSGDYTEDEEDFSQLGAYTQEDAEDGSLEDTY